MIKIINRDQYVHKFSVSAVYKGKIEMSIEDFREVTAHILKHKGISDVYQGAGKYAYVSKNILRENIEKGTMQECDGVPFWVYAFGVHTTDFIVKYFEKRGRIAPSRFKYGRNNYFIFVNAK